MSLIPLSAGFLPLLDSVLLVLAREKGFAESEGLDLHLVRETSWANIRDRAALGHFDFAMMLAPMPLAATLEAGPVGAALAKVVKASPRKFRFGVVHQTSSHNYELRYWLSASGIVPDRDIEIVVLPPPYLPDALGSGGIDGYCVGEPWNSIGVSREGAHIATVKASIWRNSPDKVIGMRAHWAEANADVVAALIRAVHKAAVYCGMPENHDEIARIMAAPHYLGVGPAQILPALTGRFDIGGGVSVDVPNHFVPYDLAANFPWTSHALWFYSQMVRWGEVQHTPERAQLAAQTFRADIYRAAMAPLKVPVPVNDSKVEGLLSAPTAVTATQGTVTIGPDGFFDGKLFDPADVDGYIAGQRG